MSGAPPPPNPPPPPRPPPPPPVNAERRCAISPAPPPRPANGGAPLGRISTASASAPPGNSASTLAPAAPPRPAPPPRAPTISPSPGRATHPRGDDGVEDGVDAARHIGAAPQLRRRQRPHHGARPAAEVPCHLVQARR